MSDKDKITEASKTELTDEQLDGAQGGAGYLKIDGIDGESKDAGALTENFSLNFSKVEFEYVKQTSTLDKSSTKLKV